MPYAKKKKLKPKKKNQDSRKEMLTRKRNVTVRGQRRSSTHTHITKPAAPCKMPGHASITAFRARSTAPRRPSLSFPARRAVSTLPTHGNLPRWDDGPRRPVHIVGNAAAPPLSCRARATARGRTTPECAAFPTCRTRCCAGRTCTSAGR